MDIDVIEPPRHFRVGKNDWVEIRDCVHLLPAENEMVRIVHDEGLIEWPVVRRRWGFSLPLALDRVTENGLRAVLSGKDEKRCHILCFDPRRLDAFLRYEEIEDHQRFVDLTA